MSSIRPMTRSWIARSLSSSSPRILLENEESRRRFAREAKAAAALDHPNICTVYEIDEVEGRMFIAMAFIDGPGLNEKIETSPLNIHRLKGGGLRFD